MVSFQTLNFEMYYFITWWIFFTECWCNGLLNYVPFMYKKKLGGKVHFEMTGFFINTFKLKVWSYNPFMTEIEETGVCKWNISALQWTRQWSSMITHLKQKLHKVVQNETFHIYACVLILVDKFIITLTPVGNTMRNYIKRLAWWVLMSEWCRVKCCWKVFFP